MKAPEFFICPCCHTKHPLEWAKREALAIQAMPSRFRSYGEETFYKSAKLQHIIDATLGENKE